MGWVDVMNGMGRGCQLSHPFEKERRKEGERNSLSLTPLHPCNILTTPTASSLSNLAGTSSFPTPCKMEAYVSNEVPRAA